MVSDSAFDASGKFHMYGFEREKVTGERRDRSASEASGTLNADPEAVPEVATAIPHVPAMRCARIFGYSTVRDRAAASEEEHMMTSANVSRQRLCRC